MDGFGYPRKKEDAKAIREGRPQTTDLAEDDRDYYLERRYPAFEILFQEMLHLEQPKNDAMKALVLTNRRGCFSDFAVAVERCGKEKAHVKDWTKTTMHLYKNSANNSSKPNMATCFRCMKKLSIKTHTKPL